MPDKWESQKENIRRLYVNDELTCKQLVAEMKSLYGFEANEKEYQRRVRKWSFRKNLKQEEWKIIGRRFAKRKAEDDKDSDLTVDGCPFPPLKIRKALGRYHFDTTSEYFQRKVAIRRSQTPEGILITTPPKQRSLSPNNSFKCLVSINDLPYFSFLSVIERHGPLFEQLANSLFCASRGTSRASSLISRKSKTALSLRSSELAPLARMSLDNSRLTTTLKNVKLEDQRAFMATVLELSNHQRKHRDLEELFGHAVMKGFDLQSGKSQVLSLVAEKDPVVESLVETLFKVALQENQVNLVQLLLKHTQIGPNDSLGHDRPLDIATERGFTAMTFALLDAGARPAQTKFGIAAWTTYAYRIFPKKDFQSVLERGVLDEPEALPGILETGDVELIASCLERSPHMTCLPESSIELAFHWAVGCEKTNLFERIMESEFHFTRKTFFAAIGRNAYHFVKVALEKGMDVNCVDERLEETPLYSAVRQDKIQVARVLFRFGANIDIPCPKQTFEYPILEAISNESEDMVKLLLKKGADVNVWHSEGMTSVAHAVLKKQHDIATYLVNWGASLERPSGRLVPTPLQIAAGKGDLHMAKVLLDRGADVNACVPSVEFQKFGFESARSELRSMRGPTALANAISSQDDLGLVKLLIDAGANVNAMREPRLSPLCTAPQLEKYSMVQLLLDAGASPIDVRALHYAAIHGNLDFIYRAIGGGLDINATDEFSQTTLETMFLDDRSHHVSNKNNKAVDCLLDLGADASKLRLPIMFQRSYPRLAQRLSKHGARRCGSLELDEAFEEGDYFAVERILTATRSTRLRSSDMNHPCFGHRYLVEAATMDDLNMVRALIRGGIDTSPSCVVVAVVRACNSKNLGMVKCLVEAGAPVNNNERWLDGCRQEDYSYNQLCHCSPLQVAVVVGAEDIVRFLLQFPTAKDHLSSTGEGKMTMHKAQKKRVHGIQWSKITSNKTEHWELGGGPKVLSLLHQAGVNIYGSASALLKTTVLQEAVYLGDVEMVECLLHLQADVNEPPYWDRGMTALQASAINGHIEIACMLLREGAEVNAAGAERDGRTALEGAAEWGRLDMVKLPLQHGADITSPGFGECQFWNASTLAREQGHNAIARFIGSHRNSKG